MICMRMSNLMSLNENRLTNVPWINQTILKTKIIRTMALKDKIMQDMKQAMRDKNKITLSALRAVKSAILLYETDGENKELDQAAEMKLLQKQVKQRKDSAQVYKEQNRPDLAENELAE